MTRKTAKGVPIKFDPSTWPKDTFGGKGTEYHIRSEQSPPPPQAFWDRALLRLMGRGLRAPDNFAYWWTDLTPYDPSLKGWKLTGHGDGVLTVLNPKEKPRRGDVKLGSIGELADGILGDYPEWGA